MAARISTAGKKKGSSGAVARAGAISVKDAWNAVALEERLELIARAKAAGIMAALLFMLMMGGIAYGFDQLWILALSCGGAVFVMQIFGSSSWRKNKPQAILSYLAARSVARRYAYGSNINDLNVVLIFKGFMHYQFQSAADEAMAHEHEAVELGSTFEKEKMVWIVLLRGAIVAMSERKGGAKLEFLGPVNKRLVCRKPNSEEEGPERAVVVTADSSTGARTVVFTSPYPGALYVFERQVQRLVNEEAKMLEEKVLGMLPDIAENTFDLGEASSRLSFENSLDSTSARF